MTLILIIVGAVLCVCCLVADICLEIKNEREKELRNKN